ncbi:MAG: hypothetical protein JNK20_00875 [Flavipsychrobacter sp.]|nr:hypothetical protein [Flavipsychrobacter sp.]
MKITEIRYYDGSFQKITKLGLSALFLEIQQIFLETKIELEETKDANGAAVIRKLVDDEFSKKDEWSKISAGGIDWIKKFRYNRTLIASIGVEVQLSARSDLLVRDLVHIRNAIQDGTIEVGVIVVPSDLLQRFLPDRTPSFKDALRIFEQEFPEAQSYPIILMAVEHDGAGKALSKQKRKS